MGREREKDSYSVVESVQTGVKLAKPLEVCLVYDAYNF